MAVSNKIVFVTAIPSNEEPRAFIASASSSRCCDGNAGRRSAVVIRRMNSRLLIHSKWCSVQKNGEAWSEFQVLDITLAIYIYIHTMAKQLTLTIARAGQFS